MIPPRSQLELLKGYEPAELDVLEEIRKRCEHLNEDEAREFGRAALERLWPEDLERLEKTTVITNKDSEPCLLKLKFAQKKFWDEVVVPAKKELRPLRAIILKGRQLGYSTLIQALHYFWCDSNAYRRAMTISYDDNSSTELFGKAHSIHNNLWFPRRVKRIQAKKIQFAEPHGSEFHTVTAGNRSAGRGNTFQHLHCSEVPMWPSAEEVITAVHQAVPPRPNTSIIWESTAKGAQGLFYERWKEAEAGQGMTPFFAPWQWDPDYSREFPNSDLKWRFRKNLKPDERRYMERYNLTLEQMNWRRERIREDLNGNAMLFRQEYPATAEEAFLTSGSPVFDGDRLLELRENITAPLWSGSIYLRSVDEQ